jgi:deoxyribodipyrimidine photo-lyase
MIVFIFRRDHRLVDNTTLLRLIELYPKEQILPMFIFDTKQIDQRKNKYFSHACVQFMIESLLDLNNQILEISNKTSKLHFFKENNDIEILQELQKICDISCVATNKDITPYSKKRDETLKKWCEDQNIDFVSEEDYTILPINTVKNNNGNSYEVFSYFLQKAQTYKIPTVKRFDYHSKMFSQLNENDILMLSRIYIKDVQKASFYKHNPNILQKGGRQHALHILKLIERGEFDEYATERNTPSLEGTTKLSAYLKFGNVSPREVALCIINKQGKSSALLRELYFREYYHNIANRFPEILSGQVSKRPNQIPHNKFSEHKWNEDESEFTKWKTGKTGVPFVDAGMRCLNKTGWLHNRMRMVCAMYLVRDLNIDWRKGERYFANKLVDYDPINNNQGWCWALTYRRKFNPYAQNAKYDPQCIYVKKWVKELKDIEPRTILRKKKM